MRRLAIVACSCGRIGFADITIAEDAPPSDARPDAPPNAQTLIFTAVADTFVSQDMESGDDRPNNFGADDKMKVKLGEDHGLLRFDTSSIPTTATVFSADLTLVNTGPGTGLTVGVHAVLEPWNEGAGSGGPGTCNWTLRDAANPWSNVGAAPPTSSGPSRATFSGDIAGPAVVGLPPAMVQSWVTDPASNFGVLLLAATDDSADFASREAVPAQRPRLTVTFVP